MEHSLKVIDILLFPRGGTRAWREACLVVQVYVVGVRETRAQSGMLLLIGAQAVVRRVHPWHTALHLYRCCCAFCKSWFLRLTKAHQVLR